MGVWDDWFYVVAPFVFYLAVVYVLAALGRSDKVNILPQFFGRISDSLHRATGYPGWAMAGSLSGLLVLLVAAMGLYWDVAWHVDLGRDELLLNPSHTMILLGLGGLMYAAAIATTFATLDGANVGLRYKKLVIPWSALALFALGLGGIASFPFDELWHRAYGIDVTLWSPTHLQLLGGGGFATLAVWMMIAEGHRGYTPNKVGRFIHIMASGAALMGITIFQGEFEFLVLQFQMAYYPVLVMLAAGFVLTAARIALGPWGALKTALFYLGVRGFLVLIVSTALNHTMVHFATYLVPALCVELAGFLAKPENRVKFALTSAALLGTVGLAAELAWMPLSGWMEVTPALLPKAVPLAMLAALGACFIGVRFGRVFDPTDDPERARLPKGVIVASTLAVIVALAVPLPRGEDDTQATMRLVDRQGDMARIQVTLDPPNAAEGYTVFGVNSNQGGDPVVSSRLIPTGEPGTYISENAHPLSGNWKTSVALFKDNLVMSAPVYLPADPQYGAPAVPALPERTEKFNVITDITLRETLAFNGPVWPSIVAYTEILAVLVAWIAIFALAERRIVAGRVDTWESRKYRAGVPSLSRG
ncbi:MAG TPA: hypothetical protein VHJ78_07260 [Actinomycetota bacterium]|nr:hypothetical protein [Actinomycetota bacterium]